MKYKCLRDEYDASNRKKFDNFYKTLNWPRNQVSNRFDPLL